VSAAGRPVALRMLVGCLVALPLAACSQERADVADRGASLATPDREATVAAMTATSSPSASARARTPTPSPTPAPSPRISTPASPRPAPPTAGSPAVGAAGQPSPAPVARTPRPTPPSASPAPRPTPSPSPSALARALTIQNFAFSPQTMTVEVGTVVTATNQDSAVHTWTADGGQWDSGSLAQGESFSFTFRVPGSYSFHCRPHPTMTGSITVR
jgi:plastocyanin